MELKILDNLLQVKSVNTARRAVHAVMSTGTIDRYGEILEPRAFARRLGVFESNPVLLADHDHTRQIGHWEGVKVTDDALVGDAIFAEGSEKAEEYWRLHRDGHRKGFSVGFINHAWEMRDVTVGGEKKRVRTYTEVELVECSSVAVPANPDALMRMLRSVGGGGDGDAHRQLMEALGQLGPQHREKQLKEQIDAIRKAVRECLSPEPGGALHLLIEAVIEQMQADQGGRDEGNSRTADDLDETQVLAALERMLKAG